MCCVAGISKMLSLLFLISSYVSVGHGNCDVHQSIHLLPSAWVSLPLRMKCSLFSLPLCDNLSILEAYIENMTHWIFPWLILITMFCTSFISFCQPLNPSICSRFKYLSFSSHIRKEMVIWHPCLTESYCFSSTICPCICKVGLIIIWLYCQVSGYFAAWETDNYTETSFNYLRHGLGFESGSCHSLVFLGHNWTTCIQGLRLWSKHQWRSDVMVFNHLKNRPVFHSTTFDMVGIWWHNLHYVFIVEEG